MIDNAWQNWATRNDSLPSQKVLDFIGKNNDWASAQIHKHKTTTILKTSTSSDAVYWEQVALVYAQLDGMAAGYNAHRGGLNALTHEQIQMLGMTVELSDIENIVDPAARPS